MKRRKHVLHWDNMPARLPIVSTIAFWLLLDRIDAHPIVWGVIGTFFCFFWVGCITALYNQRFVRLWVHADDNQTSSNE